MPKEIQDTITPESRTDVNEFETELDALLFGVKWHKTKDRIKFEQYYYAKL